jgi:hypothetical protein
MGVALGKTGTVVSSRAAGVPAQAVISQVNPKTQEIK